MTYCNSLSGHSDKIGSLNSVEDQDGNTYVASGSKDKYIRIWHFLETVNDEVLGSVMKRNIYRVGDHFIYLESVLQAHEDAVSSV